MAVFFHTKWKDRAWKIIDDVVSRVITYGIIAVLVLCKPARDWFFTVRFIVPLWIIATFVVIIGAIHIFISKRQRDKIACVKEELAEAKAHLNKAETEKLERDLADKQRATQKQRERLRIRVGGWPGN